MQKLFRRRTETRDRSHRRSSTLNERRCSTPDRESGTPERLSKYLSRLLDSNAAERR